MDILSFEHQGKGYVVSGASGMPAVILPDGKMVQLTIRMDKVVAVREVKPATVMAIASAHIFVDQQRVAFPEHYFMFEGKRYVSVAQLYHMGMAGDKLVFVTWKSIKGVLFENYTPERKYDLGEKFRQICAGLPGMTGDWYEAVDVNEITTMAELIVLLPVAELK